MILLTTKEHKKKVQSEKKEFNDEPLNSFVMHL